eukprot:3941284-Rhodomonas_salina.13
MGEAGRKGARSYAEGRGTRRGWELSGEVRSDARVGACHRGGKDVGTDRTHARSHHRRETTEEWTREAQNEESQSSRERVWGLRARKVGWSTESPGSIESIPPPEQAASPYTPPPTRSQYPHQRSEIQPHCPVSQRDRLPSQHLMLAKDRAPVPVRAANSDLRQDWSGGVLLPRIWWILPAAVAREVACEWPIASCWSAFIASNRPEKQP